MKAAKTTITMFYWYGDVLFCEVENSMFGLNVQRFRAGIATVEAEFDCSLEEFASLIEGCCQFESNFEDTIVRSFCEKFGKKEDELIAIKCKFGNKRILVYKYQKKIAEYIVEKLKA